MYKKDGNEAMYGGEYAKPIGILNSSLVAALDTQPLEGRGRRFEAFVIPVNCPTFVRKKIKGSCTCSDCLGKMPWQQHGKGK